MSFVCVLDMDETLGYFDGSTFQIRPKLMFLLQFLYMKEIKIVLWSMGEDEYVMRICNGFLQKISLYADVIFGRKECKVSERKYGFCKASEHIRTLYTEPIILIAVDDKVNQNMDDMYDLRIYVKPYKKVDSNDLELTNVVEKITSFWIEQMCPNW
ncbi:FCP1 homology domain-containing protein [Trichonephila inaurata madagascariensis]|uniref:FCP1 homology domain-containing protein n=1 Tax=Trichonephila inaurata madagascariensis TaxID=2747483 RepID=A0A8X7CHG2_9ARAC|nr:FCP1 homology domain-containing protein [Trichonephila inaurata madagascariensis]